MLIRESGRFPLAGAAARRHARPHASRQRAPRRTSVLRNYVLVSRYVCEEKNEKNEKKKEGRKEERR